MSPDWYWSLMENQLKVFAERMTIIEMKRRKLEKELADSRAENTRLRGIIRELKEKLDE